MCNGGDGTEATLIFQSPRGDLLILASVSILASRELGLGGNWRSSKKLSQSEDTNSVANMSAERRGATGFQAGTRSLRGDSSPSFLGAELAKRRSETS